MERLEADKIKSENFITFTKNKNEFKFENTSKENVSSVLIMIMRIWEQHIYYLNNEENRLLAELRDALLPELLSGRINIESIFL